MSFSSIKGHKKNIEELKAMKVSGRIPNSMIFLGEEGIGKFKTAFEFAKAIVCGGPEKAGDSLFGEEQASERTDGDACDKCQNCDRITKRLHPDVLILDYIFQAALLKEEPEKQKSIKIDSVREMSKLAYSKPSISEKKIFIINEADRMTVEAQNSSLKLLEEPPENTILILIASSKSGLLPTILSRCHIMKFSPLSKIDLEAVMGSLGVDYGKSLRLAELSGGSVKKAADFSEILALIREKSSPNELAPFLITAALGKELHEIRRNARLILELLTMVCYSRLFKSSDRFEKENSGKIIRKNSLFLKYLNQNVSPKLICETALQEYAEHFSLNLLNGEN